MQRGMLTKSLVQLKNVRLAGAVRAGVGIVASERDVHDVGNAVVDVIPDDGESRFADVDITDRTKSGHVVPELRGEKNEGF